MPASTSLIADAKSVYSNGPNAATTTKSNAASGPIQDYPGNTQLLIEKLQESAALLTVVKTGTDSTDATNLGLINGVLAALNGTSSPSGTAITALGTVYSNGPNAATTVKANAANGPIQDYLGNVLGTRNKLSEAKALLNTIKSDTDSTDSTNLTLVNNLLTALS